MSELAPNDASLLELVDRLLHKGVVLAGRATISVAGVDLIYLGLNVVLSAVETLERANATAGDGPAGELRGAGTAVGELP
ncbi:MAG: hypothetical protein AUH85_08920 [Chloroflexi bacterium 13_1_40CM_4_68_4]|nr:MAG: hypothetical protein AUH85_08920 [Chloroflexi bacterium 13_1_40CM_4_68_4]